VEKTIIEVLKIQRNEAMDTIAILNGHLAEARARITELETKGVENENSVQNPS
jgi:hypothetical protein